MAIRRDAQISRVILIPIAKLLVIILQKLKQEVMLGLTVSLLLLRMLSELSGAWWKHQRSHLEGGLESLRGLARVPRSHFFVHWKPISFMLLSDFASVKGNLDFPCQSTLRVLSQTFTSSQCGSLYQEHLQVLDQEPGRHGQRSCPLSEMSDDVFF